MSVENTETFGNYLVHGIDEIMLPDAITWWPSAPGWQVLALILLAWLLLRTIRLARRWWRNRYRREVLRQLIMETVHRPEDLDDELGHLMAALVEPV